MQPDADDAQGPERTDRPEPERQRKDDAPGTKDDAPGTGEAPVGTPSEEGAGQEVETAAQAERRARRTRAATSGNRPDTAHLDSEEIAAFLDAAKEALLAEGFYETPFQYRKKGQMFGVVKDHGHDLQLHVRAFDTGVIESEVELSHRYVEHLVSPRRSAHAEIKAIFEKHGLETETINEEFQTRTGALRERMPRTRTKTSDLVKAGLGMAGAIGAVAVARFVQRGPKKRSRWGRK